MTGAMTARRWGLSFEINSRYLLGQWEPRKILAISTYGKTQAHVRRLSWLEKHVRTKKGSFGI
jgi:hypothetical protein